VSDAVTSRSQTQVAARVEPAVAAASRSHVSELGMSCVLAAGVAFALGLVELGAPSFWFDEAYTAHVVESAPGFWLANDQYHFLYDGVVTAWAALAGSSETALRFPSVLGAMAAAALMVVLARRLAFERWTALASGLLVATSPFVVKWSQQARSYTILLALALGATLLLVRALDRGTRGSWALYGVAITVVVVWHAVAGLLLVPAHVVLAVQRRRSLTGHAPIAVVIASAIALPWAAVIAMRSTGEGSGMSWLTAPSAATVGHALLDVSGAAGLGVLLSLVGLVVLRRSGRTPDAVLLAAWAVSPFGLALLMTIVTPVFLDRYLIVAVPAFALLAAVAIVEVGRRLTPVLVTAALAATVVGLGLWYSNDEAGNWRGEDWRSAVAAVQSRSGEDVVVVIPWWSNLGAAYYGATPSATSTEDSVWVLTWSETGHDLPASVRQPLGFGAHRLVERLEFGERVQAQLWRREG